MAGKGSASGPTFSVGADSFGSFAELEEKLQAFKATNHVEF